MIPSSFRRRIRSSLENPILQSALDANAERRISVRKQAFATLPDYQSRRRKAHEIRAEVIANLESYLKEFIEKVRTNGITVHRASSQEDAIRIVLEIASENQTKLAAKSKTMVSEEIHLNQALEKAGIKVIETDLGEYIVQLRNELPSHIITPAVHLRRQEVGQTFHEKLGIPLTEEISTMTDAARSVLRQVFLEADLGISGVNFGVVDTGTLCLMTNEGNGRMVTTLPPVHVALMGIERLVPSLSDLSLMISLLPRSATGQKITVYTSLINSPRQAGEREGPTQRHLILVDNGRSVLKESPLAEILYCIRCGACLNACPVFREIGGHAYVGKHDQGSPYTGPMGSVVSPGIFGQAEFGHLARASSLCGACKEACPVDIDLPGLLLKVRAGDTKSAEFENNPGPSLVSGNAPGGLSLGLKMFTLAATSKFRFKLAVQIMGVITRIISPMKSWMRLPAFTGWGYSKDFPRPDVRPFRARWKDIEVEPVPGAQEIGINNKSTFAATGTDNDVVPAVIDEKFLFNRFKEELEALGGRVVLTDPDSLTQKMGKFFRDLDIKKIQSWEENLPPGLLEGLKKEGISVIHEANPHVSVGLTGGFAAIAETGSILVASGKGRPLSASLLPETHVAVISVKDIYASLDYLFSDYGRELKDGQSLADYLCSGAAAAIISGPSRTADIEMTLTIGVHGPKELVVFCVEDPPGTLDQI
jgi:L-lactate dehydrogenase complex protein LldF